mgnify:CR=1 FL=1
MHLKNFKTIVIKIGSSLLINDTKTIRKKWLSEFAKDIKDLLNDKKKVIIVSSGAIALGCKKLNLNKKKLKLDIKDFSKLKFSDYLKNFKEYMNIVEYQEIENLF